MQKILVLCMVSWVLSACGGGGSGTATTTNTDAVIGLKLPENMSVVTAATDTAPRTALKVYTDIDTHYSTDPARAYVYDASMESLETVNMILCLLDQTRASDMVNEGAYIALVNEDKCEQGQNQSSSGTTGQSSGGQSVEYNNWTILSTRADNDSAQIVKIWVPEEDQSSTDPMDNQTILVEVTATDAVSETKPFGSFSMNFKGVVDAANLGGTAGQEVEVMRGTLQTVDNSKGQPQFRFVNVGGDSLSTGNSLNFSFSEAANVILDDATGSGGVALTQRAETFFDGVTNQTDESTYAIAFNSTHLLRGKDQNGDDSADVQSCKSRTDFDTQVWRYNLYHAEDGTFNGQAVTGGQRVALQSGFPFTYDSDNNGQDDEYGWVGYHGVWAGESSLADGTVINQYDYETENTIQHTVNVSAGKMIRRSAQNGLLTDLQNDEFQFWGSHPLLNIHGQWVVTVDSNNDFLITGSLSWQENNAPQISSTVDHDNNPGTAEVAVAATLSLSDNENVWLWSDALGGNVVYVHNNAVAAANRSVTFYAEQFVTPGDDLFSLSNNLTLFCYDRCLKGGLTQNDINAATSESDLYYSYAGTPFEYVLSASNGKLSLVDSTSGNAVSALNLDMSSLGNDWGINSGEMTTAALANAAEPWAIFDQSVTYRWETGNNNWNQLVTVTDGQGQVAQFDRPLQFNYTHSTANDANANTAYNGKKFMLEYGGDGELWGFPWNEDTETHRWYSAFTLKDGSALNDGSNNFVVKAMEKEQSMQDDVSCGSLSISSLFTDTALTLPTQSDIGTVSHTLAQKPDVTSAPAVIEGELQ